MLDQVSTGKLQEVASLANSGRRDQAATICREITAASPQNIPALLWLGYCSPNQVESEEAIAKAYELQPQDSKVLEAVNWYNNHFVDPGEGNATSHTGTASSSDNNPLHTPVGEAIPDASNFFMSQQGGMVVASTFVLVVNLAIFLNYAFIRGISWTPFGIPRMYYAVLAIGIALIAAFVLFYAIRDVLSAPIKAHGFISNRREVRTQVKTDMGRTTEFHYELDFISDEDRVKGYATTRLTLTKAQFDASARTNRAYVIYSKRLGSVKLYQPLRSVY
ncbi:MAG TPA: hypothetical protein VH186_04375 [Chloroflexia bacterium]|nr:hypothetical protein [Chloroflexia bacterium]